MTDELLHVDDIHTYYGAGHILQGVSLTVPAGGCVALVGRNGVGKTTLARSVIGFTPPRRGRIVFRGTDVAGWSPRKIVTAGIGLVPQGRRIFPSLTVEENLRVARRGSNGEMRWDIDRVWDLFPRLRDRRTQRGGTLSGGEQQMLAIGRSLMTGPTLLILDEPTEGLAPIIVGHLAEALEELKRSGMSMLLTEQRVEFALKLADSVAVMTTRGHIPFRGTPEEYRLRPAARQGQLEFGDEQGVDT